MTTYIINEALQYKIKKNELKSGCPIIMEINLKHFFQEKISGQMNLKI